MKIKKLLKKFYYKNKKIVVIDNGENWALTQEADELIKYATNLGYDVKKEKHGYKAKKSDSFFYLDRFYYLLKEKPNNTVSSGCSFFHGKPGQSELFDNTFNALKQYHNEIKCIHISNRMMRNVLLESGIDKSKLHLIHIGIDTKYYNQKNKKDSQKIRSEYGYSVNDFVIGSFQKDGNGWDEGYEPKWIKGPDIFLEVIKKVFPQIPNLKILLSGPARGYIKSGLDKMGVSYTHKILETHLDIIPLYHALDVYLITSREEGGPKAVLEAMATGVPLVTTAVGQAADLVQNGINGWMTEVNDIDELAKRIIHIYNNKNNNEELIYNGLNTAKNNSTEMLASKWDVLFKALLQK